MSWIPSNEGPVRESPAELPGDMSPPISISLRFDDCSEETLSVTPIAANTYRLEETPVWCDDGPPAQWGDIIELAPLSDNHDVRDKRQAGGDMVDVAPQSDNVYQFVRVVEKAALRHYSCIVTPDYARSPQFERLGARILAEGGMWELAMGGVLMLHVPLHSALDPMAVLAATHQRGSCEDDNNA